MSKNKGNSVIGTYIGLVGSLYVLVGMIEIFSGFGIEISILDTIGTIFRTVGDPFNGFILMVIGAVFLKGVTPMNRGNREGMSFTTGGALMASVLLGFYTLNAFSNGLGFALGLEGWLGWTILDDVKPGVLLWFFTIPSIYLARDQKWRR